jgi:hypothetical protein
MSNGFPSPKTPASFHRLDFEALADRIFDPTAPYASEAAEVIRYAGKLQRLHDRSLCTRVRRGAAKFFNWFSLRVR